jgi:hypothetical protein
VNLIEYLVLAFLRLIPEQLARLEAIMPDLVRSYDEKSHTAFRWQDSERYNDLRDYDRYVNDKDWTETEHEISV